MIPSLELPFEFDVDTEKVLAAALVYIDANLCAKEKDPDRAAKKERVWQRKCDQLEAAGIYVASDDSTLAALEGFLARSTLAWPEIKRELLLIEASFTPPFFPYELKCKQSEVEQALGDVASAMGLPRETAQAIRASIQSAQRAHHHIAWGRIMLLATVGAVGGYFFLAPLAGGALGAAAGLNGIVGLSHGLALLGGGSLATGGFGMAGGLWLVTGASAAGLGGGSLLFALGQARALCELVKLQVAFRRIIIGGQIREATAKTIVDGLLAQVEQLDERIAQERQLNEKNCRRVEELERILCAYKDAVEWMKSNGHEKQ